MKVDFFILKVLCFLYVGSVEDFVSSLIEAMEYNFQEYFRNADFVVTREKLYKCKTLSLGKQVYITSMLEDCFKKLLRVLETLYLMEAEQYGKQQELLNRELNVIALLAIPKCRTACRIIESS